MTIEGGKIANVDIVSQNETEGLGGMALPEYARQTVEKQSLDIDVISGRYTVDAKSILGLCSLDLEKPVLVRVYGEDADGQSFRGAVEKLVTEPPEEK